MKILLSFTRPSVVPNLYAYELLVSIEFHSIIFQSMGDLQQPYSSKFFFCVKRKKCIHLGLEQLEG